MREILFGWLCRPILLWSVLDILTIIIEVAVISYVLYIIKFFVHKVRNKNKLLKFK